MPSLNLGECNDIALASIVTSWEMPGFDISDRTQTTRRIGALEMMKHLVEGDWEPDSGEVMREFIGRVLLNAERQGISVEPVPNV